MTKRLYNAKIITMVEGEDIFDGEIHIDGNKISYVGPASEGGSFDEEIDCEGNVLLPGFKNAHTHSGMTAFRSLADDLNLQDWLNNEIFPREARMTPEDVYWLSQLAYLEYLTSGITACGDMYLTPESILDASVDFGMRCQMVSGLNKFGPTLEVLERRYNELNGKNELVGFLMGVHAEYTCDKELLEKVDYVFLCVPLTEETRGFFGAEQFAAMKETAIMINTSRGEIVDEDALFAALKDKKIGGAAMDTWYNNPKTPFDTDCKPSLKNPFETLDNLVLSPHRAAMIAGELPHLEDAVMNINRTVDGLEPLNVVSVDKKF